MHFQLTRAPRILACIEPLDPGRYPATAASNDLSRTSQRGQRPLGGFGGDPSRVPQRILPYFWWYRMDPGPGDRIGFELLAQYALVGMGPSAPNASLATAGPIDGCARRAPRFPLTLLQAKASGTETAD